LKGRETRFRKQEVIADLEKVLGIPFDGFSTILRIRADGKASEGTGAVLLFEKYLKEIDALIRFVDQIDR
jgi:hypothetical protein